MKMTNFYMDRYGRKSHIIINCMFFFMLAMILVCYLLGFPEGPTIMIAAIIFFCMLMFVITRERDSAWSKIERYCKESGHTIDELKQEFKSAIERGKDVRESRNWIYFMDEKGIPDIIEKSNITHSEYRKSFFKGYLYVYCINNKLVKIPMRKRAAELLQICR